MAGWKQTRRARHLDAARTELTHTWIDPKTKPLVRFPRGLKPVGDAAHRHGLKFVLWFEPERVMLWTCLRAHHPEWLLSPVNLLTDAAYQKIKD